MNVTTTEKEIALLQPTFGDLAPCEKIQAFSSNSYQQVSATGHSVTTPKWMQDELKAIPKDVVANCITEDLKGVVSSLIPDEFNEIAVQRIYALAFKAAELQVISDPAILANIKIAICEKNADPFGSLAFEYYLWSQGHLLDYEYGSESGKRLLHDDVCNME